MIIPNPDINSFIKTLRNKRADFIPIAELGVHPIIKEKFIGKKILTIKDEIEFWFKAGYDYVKLQPMVDFNPAKIKSDSNLTFNDDGSIFRKWASESSGVITSIKEFEQYVFPKLDEIVYKRFEEAAKNLPEGMGIVGQYGDIFTMTWEMMGFENFSLSLFEDDRLIKLINDEVGKIVLRMFENMSQIEEVKALWYSDDIAYSNGLMVSPDTLDKYFFPWLKKIGEIAKSVNKPLIYHSDGVLFDVMDKIIDCGVNALHPIEPKAMNIVEVKNRYGDKLCLIGNIDVDLLARGSKEEVVKNVLFNIENIGRKGGYCVGSGNSIPEYVNLENYIAMIETVKSIS
ncbi:Uroporphyrinogen-III decarboxylase-like protein [Ignavibacterium album JCM 16511]|uniref:Uroporphyrinogen-III decarboxylase-like protein n=1 Tax=Ignavibacterium album (strain DSM 19864 / JCM 16511 / NBRC 101810 / Mat9-16) TaxID=945713 RepID=I0AKL7_IGNAJ|nr:uroporphyrinogen decarboxylase family protein [Ignavibacterium album]AFH49524.1 Uroporphyrinogen-III decarboxylase-like protein [Ignavibacterium album JCM 16511]